MGYVINNNNSLIIMSYKINLMKVSVTNENNPLKIA